MTHGEKNDPVKKPTQRACLLPANGNTCDQIVLKHSLNPSPTKDIILVTFLSFGLIIMAKKIRVNFSPKLLSANYGRMQTEMKYKVFRIWISIQHARNA